jgi:hypothetical protein
MQLSDHDLKQLDEERVRSLTAESLCILSLKLLAELKEARDRLNQSPQNSSRPPSNRAPWEKAGGEEESDEEPADVGAAAVDREGKQEAQGNDPPPEEQGSEGVEGKESEPSEKPRGKSRSNRSCAKPSWYAPTRAAGRKMGVPWCKVKRLCFLLGKVRRRQQGTCPVCRQVLEASQEHRLHHKDENQANKRIDNVMLLHRSCQLQPQQAEKAAA